MSIALYRDDDSWRQLLEQEGASFQRNWDGAHASVVLLSAEPDRADLPALRRMVENGGAVFGSARDVSAVWPEIRCRSARLDYIVPDGSPLFRHVGIVDIGQAGWRAEAAGIGTDQSGRPAIASVRIGNGQVIALPFDLARLATDTRSVQRHFHTGLPRPPFEKVSQVGRGEVRRLLANCLRQLLWRRDEPYVHLAYNPGRDGTVFGVRIDADGGTASAMPAAVEIADSLGIKLSWFVHTGSPTADLQSLIKMAGRGHDVQLHCHAHRVYPDYDRNLTNVRRGIAEMDRAGLYPTGFVAPYGDWNEMLARALSDAGIDYSSEFSYAYDDLPSFPLVGGARSRVLQVPVHPVCIGVLRAAGARSEAMERYFRGYINLQAARREPCLLYDHPESIGRHPGVFRTVLTLGAAVAGGSTTLTSFATWWRERLAARWRVHCGDEGLTVEADSKCPDLLLSVERADRSASVPLVSNSRRYEELSFVPSPVPVPFNADCVAVRRLTLRDRVRGCARAATKSLQERRQRL